jgi:hypothetical protein
MWRETIRKKLKIAVEKRKKENEPNYWNKFIKQKV